MIINFKAIPCPLPTRPRAELVEAGMAAHRVFIELEQLPASERHRRPELEAEHAKAIAHLVCVESRLRELLGEPVTRAEILPLSERVQP